ncbi:hypothetical protein EVAR_68864_1 [Eumeta japonica]|uniref:Uncharacterized protein n=1 Tax=Eumeta variegata TaxID=151549 RepID=A0A4C1ZD94_EUMVA|nr:hypothetical protein EVAR_68864_1 [Eumeta japonica]
MEISFSILALILYYVCHPKYRYHSRSDTDPSVTLGSDPTEAKRLQSTKSAFTFDRPEDCLYLTLSEIVQSTVRPPSKILWGHSSITGMVQFFRVPHFKRNPWTINQLSARLSRTFSQEFVEISSEINITDESLGAVRNQVLKSPLYATQQCEFCSHLGGVFIGINFLNTLFGGIEPGELRGSCGRQSSNGPFTSSTVAARGTKLRHKTASCRCVT